MLNRMRLKGFGETLEVRHKFLPFYMTWYVDARWKNVTSLVNQWLTGQQLRPTMVVLSQCLLVLVLYITGFMT